MPALPLEPCIRIEGKCPKCKGEGCPECNNTGLTSQLISLEELRAMLTAEDDKAWEGIYKAPE